ncbi:UDP-N-acetylglucosamine 2-epimerase [Cohnella hongkongensis]|uniref:UDP-N-acetylglucosamine 2-epimerase n=1 Tax=Cohnella hongkongensis TaxID=178337 RepID=A0ABV9FM45_9BACL
MAKICIVTGSRADYGLLCGLMREIDEDPELTLMTAVTGSHLSPLYGNTYRQIEEDGFRLTVQVPLDLSGNSSEDVAEATAQGIRGFARAYRELEPDLVVVLGDRYEIMAAASAAMLLNIPIAHVHGGETTEGAIDNAMRHAMTKMAHLHFTAAEAYRRRVIQMGERPDTVFNVGSPGADRVRGFSPIDLARFEELLDFRFREANFLVTLHPVTLKPEENEQMTRETLQALDRFPEASVLITLPNADQGSRGIRAHLERYAERHPGRVKAFESLGHHYLNAMFYSSAVIGNSSSGIIEAPAMRIPTVNIGDRQKGRLRAASVIDCEIEAAAIEAAIRRALSDEFRRSFAKEAPPYGSGDSAFRMKEILKRTNLRSLLSKSFYDLEISR